MNELIQLLRTLQRDHFFGSIEISMRAGSIVSIRKTETFRYEDLRTSRENRGNKYAENHNTPQDSSSNGDVKLPV